jgi:hypothetical protein
VPSGALSPAFITSGAGSAHRTQGAGPLTRSVNLAIPANEFANLATLPTEGHIEDYEYIHGDEALRHALHDFHWLPTPHGALLKTLPVHEPNDLFNTAFRLFSLQSPIRKDKREAAFRLLSDKQFAELPENLEYFRDRYGAILKERYGNFDGLASVRGTPYRRVERLHYQYIGRQLTEVEAMLEYIAGLDKRLLSRGDMSQARSINDTRDATLD